MKTENNNEQLILEAAEAEFLEKGYNNAATTAIAKRAGVTHAMLHYYFRTKVNLFQKVFQNKVRLIGDSFFQCVNEDVSLEEAIRKFTESHFEFIRQNPKLVSFVYNEVALNKENRSFLINQVRPKIFNMLNRMDELLAAEISKGNVKPVKVHDLLFNIVSINVMTFMAYPIIGDLINTQNSRYLNRLINERKESNVQFVLNALKA
ncbi:MAG: TetR/AcrR family transcriptional regulator [Candidatus Azobacteroides sp.]|nr:TetR/AcrR family transcriptional regulator [Candidatus Azobacteroides sp.]